MGDRNTHPRAVLGEQGPVVRPPPMVLAVGARGGWGALDRAAWGLMTALLITSCWR